MLYGSVYYQQDKVKSALVAWLQWFSRQAHGLESTAARHSYHQASIEGSHRFWEQKTFALHHKTKPKFPHKNAVRSNSGNEEEISKTPMLESKPKMFVFLPSPSHKTNRPTTPLPAQPSWQFSKAQGRTLPPYPSAHARTLSRTILKPGTS